ncbi:hypothetical protein SAMN05660772_01130 [Pasteurella testudinis DSM 23072]|uniref:Lipoprotein n=1 Tax=Pasteurella testudinis DSM 23072 TaxID=1122938 RepID=A0A1W1V5B1_9PAST|nr:hypothetical protein [Pasteurella testudinis]SMB88221.1 hypothetical protein SAMN05660772_01130 [Pasteurella testudinis DSM 23072]SUB51166.1 Uncharacterised protein [Pasteurella testudinis]
MKKYLILLSPFMLAACVHPMQHTAHKHNMPTKDMKTVEEYHKQVMSGNTARQPMQHDNIALNGSDHKPQIPNANISAPSSAVWQKQLPKYERQIFSQGTSQRNTTMHKTTHKTTEILKDTPTEKQTRTVEKSETKWNSKGFSFGL